MKKTKTKAPDIAPLNKVESYYLRAHRTQSAEQLAEDLGRPVEFIQQQLDALPKIVKDGFERKKGATIMTPEASAKGDEAPKGLKHPTNRGGLHILRPGEPIH